jgi:hypothetical protein
VVAIAAMADEEDELAHQSKLGLPIGEGKEFAYI